MDSTVFQNKSGIERGVITAFKIVLVKMCIFILVLNTYMPS